MSEIEFIIFNLINSLSTSRISTFLIDNNQYDDIHLQLEITNAVLNFEEPEMQKNSLLVSYKKLNGEKTYLEFITIDDNTIEKIDIFKTINWEDANFIVLYISKKNNNRSLKMIQEKIFETFETQFNFKNFNFLNGYFGVIFYSNYHTNVVEEKSKPKRKKVSLPRGTYTKTLISVKEWLEKEGETSVRDLMKKFEDKITEELNKLKEKDNLIDIDEELKIFRQDYDTGAKRSQLLLHTVNEPNRVYFRNKVTAKFDLFYYTDYNSRLFDRKIKAFNHDDLDNNQIDVYYEKGEKPIKVIDFKNRYETDFNSSYKK
jgi:hypothetical protein